MAERKSTEVYSSEEFYTLLQRYGISDLFEYTKGKRVEINMAEEDGELWGEMKISRM
jgi:hypothetical protein